MAGYNLQLTNGNLLVIVPDGTSDSATTSLTLVGRNFPGYGIYLNQNFVKLTENFSNGSAPNNPLRGQLWWDSSNILLKVYDGAQWKVVGSGATGEGNDPPENPVEGDIWWDPVNKQLFVWNSSGAGTWSLIGPTSSAATTATDFLSNVNGINTLGNISIMGKTVAVFNNGDYAPFSPTAPISGITTVRPGMNFSGTVESSMISSPNMIFGVSSNNIQVTSLSANQGFKINLRPGNVETTCFTVNGVNGRVTVASDPQENLGVATKQYVDAIAANLETVISQTVANVELPTDPGGNTVFESSIVPSANLLYNLGSTTTWWNNIYGTAIHAKYADLAERFEADEEYEAGTVVELGGPAEITAVVEDLSEDVFGVISTQAAYLMNSSAGSDASHPPVAVQGRVPVKVIGPVQKGDRLVSAGNGYARVGKKPELTAWNVIGRALENKNDDGPGMVEAVVKLNS